MRMQKRQWAIWDKKNQKFVRRSGCIIFLDKERAWLIANKERKGEPYRVIRVNISIPPHNDKE